MKGAVVCSAYHRAFHRELGHSRHPRADRDEQQRLIDEETRRIVVECEDQAVSLLTRERPRLDALVAALLKDESLDEAEIRAATGLPAADAGVRAG